MPNVILLVYFCYRSRTKSTSQRKVGPPSKFNIDRNALRSLEISGPIQIPPPASAPPPSHFASSTFPHRTPRSIVADSNVRQSLVSSPIPTITENPSTDTSKLVPVRPAPPRPDHIPQRTPSWAPASVGSSSTVSRTSSLRSPSDKSAKCRPLSTSSFRPSCPPPRPPPPKNEPVLKQENQSCMYEDITKNLEEHERSATPSSTYYDDCQTLDFSNTALSFVHTPAQREINSNEMTSKNNFKSQEQSGCLANKSDSRTFNIKNDRPTSAKPVISQSSRPAEKNSVAALAQKFEDPKKNFAPNTTMRPPFKSRPLPPRPGSTQV